MEWAGPVTKLPVSSKKSFGGLMSDGFQGGDVCQRLPGHNLLLPAGPFSHRPWLFTLCNWILFRGPRKYIVSLTHANQITVILNKSIPQFLDNILGELL